MTDKFDVAIVGGGIVGLAHAWMAAARGQRVVLFESSPLACGASVRNFGMVWPIGQPQGEYRQIALRSRALWLELAKRAGIWVKPCGSLHVAHQQDELNVLEEFVSGYAASGEKIELLTARETLQRSPAVKSEGLLGAMWSPTELCVNPRAAIAAFPHWLHETYGVKLKFATTVCNVAGRQLTTANGQVYQADRTVVCSGSDFRTLFPQEFADAGLKLCKLQMMQTKPQPGNWLLGPHLASGLTLRHYTSFGDCPSLAALKSRVASQTPELDNYGIHVMASQNELGQVTLGDSHQYDDEISPFDETQIDELMLRELKRQFHLPDWSIAKRWHGIYAKHPSLSMLEMHPQENVCICVGPGGAGMTLSLGYADRYWTRLTEKEWNV